ncbi:PD-(D/E)XK nuclease family protein [Candidatus Micrarchaeota archaeon]|nr:PD-(D/E)XK nuclease family protein [Candidatus Micrarchaeota archaeon]
MEPFYLDNSKRDTWKQCRNKYFLSVIKELKPDAGSAALRAGATWHGIQEGYNKYILVNGWPTTPEENMRTITAGFVRGKEVWDRETAKRTYVDDFRNFNTLVDAFGEYLDNFASDRDFITILQTEQVFDHVMIPENEVEYNLMKDLPPIHFTGKIDLGIKMDGRNWLLDYKTTSWWLDKVIMEANRSPQLIGYSYVGNKVFNFVAEGCLLSYLAMSARKSPKTGEYGKVGFNFRRVPQIYTEGDIQAWKFMFLLTCKEILDAEKTGFYPQSFDCYRYGQCAYLPLCQQHRPFEELSLVGFHVEPWDVLDEQ